LHEIQRLPSGASPPPGTIMCTCGWWVIAEPQVWSTDVMHGTRLPGSAAVFCPRFVDCPRAHREKLQLCQRRFGLQEEDYYDTIGL
jgi:hypothetical protein